MKCLAKVAGTYFGRKPSLASTWRRSRDTILRSNHPVQQGGRLRRMNMVHSKSMFTAALSSLASVIFLIAALSFSQGVACLLYTSPSPRDRG